MDEKQPVFPITPCWVIKPQISWDVQSILYRCWSRARFRDRPTRSDSVVLRVCCMRQVAFCHSEKFVLCWHMGNLKKVISFAMNTSLLASWPLREWSVALELFRIHSYRLAVTYLDNRRVWMMIDSLSVSRRSRPQGEGVMTPSANIHHPMLFPLPLGRFLDLLEFLPCARPGDVGGSDPSA